MRFLGVAPVAANATTTAGLWLAGLTSLGAYREQFRHLERREVLVTMCIASAVGGGLGAKLLLVTSDATFIDLLPFLMLFAALVFSFGRRVAGLGGGTRFSLGLGALVQLVISAYGGYFGGGMGIMMLATMTLMGMTAMHEMNALKVTLGLLINGVALTGFVIAGKVLASAAVPVAVGAALGGWLGAALAQRVDSAHVRKLVLAIAWLLTLWFFWSTFGQRVLVLLRR
jgi:uncharacterized membrane protein YfcA